MTRILPLAMVFALLNVIAICPLVASESHTTSSCCPHHSKGPQIPCTDSTGQNCPYVLLEKAKSERSLRALLLAAIPAALGAPLHASLRNPVLHASEFHPDLSDSYLAHRVLRL